MILKSISWVKNQYIQRRRVGSALVLGILIGGVGGYGLCWLRDEATVLPARMDSGSTASLRLDAAVDSSSPLLMRRPTSPEKGAADTIPPEPLGVNSHIDYGKLIDEIGRQGNVDTASLDSGLLELHLQIQDFPHGAKLAAWASYVTGRFNHATASEVTQLALNPSRALYDALTNEYHGNTSYWDELMMRCATRLYDLGENDAAMRTAEWRFENGNPLDRQYAASLAMHLLLPREAIASRLGDYSDKYQHAIQDQLLAHWAKYNRRAAFDYLLGSATDYVAAPQQLADILDYNWFAENASELSAAISDAPPSSNRDIMILHMLETFPKTEGNVRNLWLDELSDPRLRSSVGQRR